MLVATLLGIVAGAVGFLPLVLAKFLARSRNQNIRQNSIMLGLLLVFTSLIILTVLLFVASRVAPETFLGFGIGAVASFLVASLILAGLAMRRERMSGPEDK